MVVIFGWGAGQGKDQGETAPLRCPNCHNDVFLHHVKSEKKVSLYFVPIAQYGTDEYLACPICGHGLQISPQQRAAVVDMRHATSLFRRGGMAPSVYQAKVDRFWAQMGVQGAVGPGAVASPGAAAPSGGVAPGRAAPASPPAAPSLAEQLAELGRLRDGGVLTGEEFAAAKRRLIGS